MARGWAEDGLESGKLSDLSTLCTEEKLQSGKQEPEVTFLHSVPLLTDPEEQEQRREQEKIVDITFKNQE